MTHPDWLMKKKSSVKCLFVSDIHFLHPRVSTEDIARRMIKELVPVFLSTEITYLIFAGDIFDEAGYLPEDDFMYVQAWFSTILTMARKHNTKIRILEGTPSHDRKQSKHFPPMNNRLPEDLRVDLKYINTIEVVYEDDGSTWLYVPDEVHHDPDVVLELIKDKLHHEHLDKVDFMVTHGMYKNHLKMGMPFAAHDPDAYLSLANLYIDNGHIHTPSVYKKRFITNGSFDRLKQGEEERKGCWLLEVSEKGRSFDKLTFIENKEATYMVTINLLEHTFEKALIAVEKHCHPEEKRYIRIDIGEELHANGIVKHFSDKYPNIRWSKKIHRAKDKEADELLVFQRSEDIITINENTISDLLIEEMRIANVSEEEIKQTISLLEQEAA